MLNSYSSDLLFAIAKLLINISVSVTEKNLKGLFYFLIG